MAFKVNYDLDGRPSSITENGVFSFPITENSSEFLRFKRENDLSKDPIDYVTPIPAEKLELEPTVQEELLAMKAIIRGFTNPNEPSTVEEVDLLVKTGWMTEEQAEAIKVGK